MDDDVLEVNEWIFEAQGDYDHSVWTATEAKNPYAPKIVCFHCQQSAEKILKAYSIAKEGTRIKEHSPEILLNRCKSHSPDFGSLDTACAQLSLLITKSRYPSKRKLTASDMNAALQAAAQILEFTKAKLKELGYEYLPEQDNRQTPT
ncbi:MAG: HEPN domain-containing protein [Chitinispirillia bacterium]|nr:HEPN domain-containing protein [Chitinispirillia bacterium]